MHLGKTNYGRGTYCIKLIQLFPRRFISNLFYQRSSHYYSQGHSRSWETARGSSCAGGLRSDSSAVGGTSVPRGSSTAAPGEQYVWQEAVPWDRGEWSRDCLTWPTERFLLCLSLSHTTSYSGPLFHVACNIFHLALALPAPVCILRPELYWIICSVSGRRSPMGHGQRCPPNGPL